MRISTCDISELPSLSSGTSLFATREWASIYLSHIQAYQILGKGDHVLGTFILFHKKKLVSGYTITPPMAPHIGLIAHSESEKAESKQSFWKSIHKTVAHFIASRDDALIEFCLSTDHSDSQEYTWSDFIVRPRHTYLLNLADSQDDLLSAMSPERRKNIRKAEADGLLVSATQDVSRFLNILNQTIDRQGIKLDQSILRSVLESASIANNRAMYICSKGREDLAASLVVWDNGRAYYLIGGYDKDNSHEGAGTLNLWQAIKDAKSRGNKIFDFEGSMIPQVEKYFRGFGGELHTFFSIERKQLLAKIAQKLKS